MKRDRASGTAKIVAGGMLLAASLPNLSKLVHPDDFEILRNGLRPNFAFTIFPKLLESFLIPGLVTHFALRKYFINQLVTAEISKGIDQLIVLGAGFDLLAYRLAREGKVSSIEIDHPATQRSKQNLLRDRTTPNLEFLPADLAKTSLSDSLKSSRLYISDKPTIIVIEGVLMYLTEDENLKLFLELGQLHSPSLIFTYMDRRANGEISFIGQSTLVNLWLRLKHEEFKFGTNYTELANLVGQHNLKISEIIDDQRMIDWAREDLSISVDPAKGEHIAICRK